MAVDSTAFRDVTVVGRWVSRRQRDRTRKADRGVAGGERTGDLDAVFRALTNEQRRRGLSCLERHHAVSLPDLAERVAEATVTDADGIVDISANGCGTSP